MMRSSYLLLILFLISYAPKSSNGLKAQTSPSYGTSTEESSDDYENDFKVTDINLTTIKGYNYLTINIIERNPKGAVYPFPIYRIVSNGVVVGELKPGAYDLHADGSKNVPTTLETLPDDFECIVYISALEESLPKYELHYRASPKEVDNKENDFKVTDITLTTIKGYNYLTINIIERNPKGAVYPFPIYRIVSNGVVVGELKPGAYDLHADGSKNVPTTLETLPDDFECIVYISALEESLPKYELHYKAIYKEEIPSTSVDNNTSEKAENKKNLFEVTSIEFITIDGENYLRVYITDRNPNGQFYPYPCYKITSSDGEVIGDLGLKTYGLGGPEDIPTSLTALPKDFECVVHLSTYGDMGVESHELVYKSK